MIPRKHLSQENHIKNADSVRLCFHIRDTEKAQHLKRPQTSPSGTHFSTHFSTASLQHLQFYRIGLSVGILLFSN
jgi:hypothetical protein